MKWLRGEMDKRFKVKTQVIGSGLEEEQEGRILNRIIRCTVKGWEYEPDQRHAELIVKELGLEDAKGTDTPGEKIKDHEKDKVEDQRYGCDVLEKKG